jgi:hypothetical protein
MDDDKKDDSDWVYVSIYNVTPHTPLGCSLNTEEPGVARNGTIPGSMCYDDCAQVYGSGYKCDYSTCACEPPGTVIQVSCASRQGYSANQSLPAGAQCKDDCQALGPGYTCDPSSCTCVPGTVTGVSCASRTGHTVERLQNGTQCRDDCASLGAGYTCDPSCYCKPPSAVSVPSCGDGIVTAPEECDPGNTYTAQCYNGNICQDCSCGGTATTGQTHTECDYNHQACVSVDGPGTNECSSDSQCVQPTHKECSGGSCVSVDGSGTDQCSSDSQCAQAQPPPPQTHTECDYAHGACMVVNGSGTSECGSDSDCSPPVVDCQAYCSSHGYSQSLGSDYPTSDQCKAAAAESAVQCTTTCIYSSFYSASNQAGTTTCCCKAKYTYSCSGCPGPSPQCPQCPEIKP